MNKLFNLALFSGRLNTLEMFYTHILNQHKPFLYEALCSEMISAREIQMEFEFSSHLLKYLINKSYRLFLHSGEFPCNKQFMN